MTRHRRSAPIPLLLAALAVLAPSPAQGATRKPRPAAPFDGWKATKGAWRAQGDLFVQTDRTSDCRAFAEPADWDDYVFEVKARKTSGAEGFLILFRVRDPSHFYWWNIAGWGNTRHALETRPKRAFPSKPGRVHTGRWYAVRIVVRGPSIQCYLDGKLIHDIKDSTYKKGGIGLGSWSTAVEYKDVSVATLDGRKLYGTSPMELADAALTETGAAGAALRENFVALRDAATAADNPKWQALYRQVADLRDRLREARGTLGKLDLKTPRTALESIVRECPDQKAQAERLLERLADDERQLASLRQAAARGGALDLAGVERIVALTEEITTFRRSLYIPRCPPVAFIKRQANGRRGTNGTMLCRSTAAGSAICIYDPAHPDLGARTIFEDKEGYIFDMSPSFDARKLLFAYKRKVRERKDPFHIWEINADGTGLRQITDGRYHDVSPVYLPDGRICFVSTRVEAFSMCQNFLAAALYVAKPDGSRVRRLEYNTLSDTSPYVLDDGSILFSRWEYQDKNIFCVQGLWTLNPDGSRLQLFYGNTLTIPNSIYGAKQIPGTRKVICTMAAHHHRPVGAIAIIDRGLGFENPEGMVNITPEVPYTPRVGQDWHHGNNGTWRPGDRLYPWSYADPWPIDQDLFLVAYGGPMKGGPQRFRIFLLDDKGGKVVLYDDPATSCFHPMPLRPRPVPHRFPSNLPEPKGEGTFFVQDIYQGLENKGVTRGQVKALRIWTQIPKKYNTEGPRYRDHYPAIGRGSYYPKLCYGSVPVADDGSVYFKAPAGAELFFQAIDAEGKEIRRMGTVTQITNGEIQSCVGCHEPRNATPANTYRATPRLVQEPDRIAPPPWGAVPIDFTTLVQPVLDRYCVRCHSGRAPKASLDLSGGKTRFFNMAFESLVDRRQVAYYWMHDAPTGNFPPLASGSYVSPLTKRIESNHSKVNMDPESRRRIYAWIDANVPYYGTWDMSRPHTTGGRDTWRTRVNNRTVPEPWFRDFAQPYRQHCSPCHGSRTDLGVRDPWVNLTRPEFSRVLNAHLSTNAGGLGIEKPRRGFKPLVFEDTSHPVYQALLKSIEAGKRALEARPRMDMPGGTPVAQGRDFGRTY